MSREQELSVAEKIKENGYDIRVIINEDEPYTLYCAVDIGKLLGRKNIHSTIRYFHDDEKIFIKSDTNGGMQNMAFFTYKGLLHIINISRQSICSKFANDLGINIHQTKFDCIETETLECIKRVFKNETMIHQFVVDKCRIDLYFPEYKLAIECDENTHTYRVEQDIDREKYIRYFIPGIHFIRYKPQAKDFNIFETMNEIYIYILSKKGLKA